MKRAWIFLIIVSLLAACAPAATPAVAPTQPPATPTPVPEQPTPTLVPTEAPQMPEAKAYKFGYVLHGLNEFTQVIKKGAEDAAKALGAEIEVVAPSSFEQPTEAIGLFEGFIQKKVSGIAVVTNPGDVWGQPLQEAKNAGIPVMTANVPPITEDAVFGAWFGQDEYQSGVILATELKKALEAEGKTEGKIVVGICAPGVSVLVDRYNGFKKGLEGTNYTVSEPMDVTHDITTNYSAWENLATANPDMVAAVGLCSIDIPNMATLKTRTNAKWLIGGYDLNVPTLDAIKAGVAQVTVGQHPYLQGYLPILALYQTLEGKLSLDRQWVNVGTEVVTKENVETVYKRESDPEFMTQWYADYIAKNFSDLQALAQPCKPCQKAGQ